MNQTPLVRCRQCGGSSPIPDVAPYLIQNAKGQFGHVWLHPACSPGWHQKYREWIKEVRYEQEKKSAAG